MAKKPQASATAAGTAPVPEAPAKSKHPAFIFVGDTKGHGPDTIEAFGLTFAKNGAPTPVEDAAVAKKLAANGHFKAA